MAPMPTARGLAPLGIARAYHDAWERGEFDSAERLLSEDLVVDVPVNSYGSKASFMVAAKMTRQIASRVTPFADFGGAHDAVLIYDMQLPIGMLRVAEHFVISEDGLIVKITHVHDTVALRAAGMG